MRPAHQHVFDQRTGYCPCGREQHRDVPRIEEWRRISTNNRRGEMSRSFPHRARCDCGATSDPIALPRAAAHWLDTHECETS